MVKKTTLLILISFLMVFLVIGNVNAADSINSGIKNGVDATPNGGTLNLQNNVYSSINDSNIIINKNITIVGESKEKTIIDGKNKSWIFRLNAGNNLKLVNLTFKNGKGENGGAIISSGKLTVENCIFINNYATSSGGAIFNVGNNSIVTNTSFTNNYGENYGGAIQNRGNNFIIFNSSFTSNSAKISGGAVLSEGNNLIINNSKFNKNKLSDKSTSAGGAVRNNGKTGFTVENSQFSENTALVRGGAILNQANNFNIINSNFTQNFALYGAGVFNYGNNSAVDSSDFINNVAKNDGRTSITKDKGYGGGVYNYKGDNFIISSSNFYNNIAEDYGGAVMSFSGKYFTISKSDFKNNSAVSSAKGDGGSVANYDGNYFTLTNSNLSLSKANNGGGFYSSGNGTKVTYTQFTSNTGLKNGGAIYGKGNQLSLTNVTINKNLAPSGGGILNLGSNFKVTNSIFTNNRGTRGGGISNGGNNANINNVEFTNNNGSDGGAVYSYGNNLVVDKSTFNLNNADYGGAIRNTLGTKLLITSSDFTNNKANTSGGAIINGGSNAIIKSSSFNKNSAKTYGGAIYNVGGTGLSISKSEFIGNSAKNGGMICNSGKNIKVNYNRIVSNANTVKTTVKGNFNYNWWGKNSALGGLGISTYYKVYVYRIYGENDFTYSIVLNTGSGSGSSLLSFNGYVLNETGQYSQFNAIKNQKIAITGDNTYKFKVDNQVFTVSSKTKAIKLAKLSISSSLSKTSVKKSQVSIFTLKIKNSGVGVGKSVLSTFSITSGLSISKVVKSQGTMSGTKWNLGNLQGSKTATLKLYFKSSKKANFNINQNVKYNNGAIDFSVAGKKLVLKVK